MKNNKMGREERCTEEAEMDCLMTKVEHEESEN